MTAMNDQFMALLPGKSYLANANPARDEKIKAVARLRPTTVMVLRAAVSSE